MRSLPRGKTPEKEEQRCGGTPRRATDPRTGGDRPKERRAPTQELDRRSCTFNFERLFSLCSAFEGDLSEVASAVGGTLLASWFMAVVLLPHLKDAGPASHRVRLWRGRACVHRSTVMVIDSCVSEVNCGTLEKVPSVDFAGVSTTTWEARVSVRRASTSTVTCWSYLVFPCRAQLCAVFSWQGSPVTCRCCWVIFLLWGFVLPSHCHAA